MHNTPFQASRSEVTFNLSEAERLRLENELALITDIAANLQVDPSRVKLTLVQEVHDERVYRYEILPEVPK